MLCSFCGKSHGTCLSFSFILYYVHLHARLPACGSGPIITDHLLYYFLGGANDASNDGNGVNAKENDDEGEEGEPPVHTPISIFPVHDDVEPVSVTSGSASATGGGVGASSGVGNATSMTSIAEECLGGGLTITSSLESFIYARARESSDTLGPTSPMSGAGARAASGNGASAASPQHQHSVHFQDGGGGGGQQQYRRMGHPSSQSHQRTTSSGSIHKVASTNSHSSSSSSLTSMAAALALGGPNQVLFMQQKLQSSSSSGVTHYQLNNTSPITPLNMLGLSPSGHEMMMLPPPPRFPNGANCSASSSNSQIQTDSAVQAQHQKNVGQQHHPTNLHAQVHPQQLSQQQSIPQLAATNAMQNSSQTSQRNRPHPLTEQQPNNFLPQMHQIAGGVASRQQQQQFAPMSGQKLHMGFPDPKSIINVMLPSHHHYHPSQPISQSLPSQLPSTNGGMLPPPSHLPFPPLPPPPQQLPSSSTATKMTQQQIQIGLSGQTIPITAISGEDGSIQYQVDPSVLPNGVLPTTSGLRYFTKAINEVSKPDTQKEIDPEVLAEKRRQRLARNRESARQSRRRKKELLVTLSAKVRKLQSQLEKEVRSKIGSVEVELTSSRNALIDAWLAEQQQGGRTSNGEHDSSMNIDWERRNTLARILRTVGINCEIRRTVIAHQYHFLRQAFLSPHNHFAIWMMIQSSTFFTEASRRQQNELALSKGSNGTATAHAASTQSSTAMGNGAFASKTHSSRANSRQIGETMYNEENAKQQMSGDASYSDENSTQFGGDASYNDDSKRGQSCYVACNAKDERKMWPLYCHEIGVTMEQEDRIINQLHTQ